MSTRSGVSRTLLANPWRNAFFLLLFLVGGVLLWATWFWLSITSPTPQKAAEPPTRVVAGEGVPIDVGVSMQAINDIVAMQLAKKESPVKEARLSFEEKRLLVDTKLTFFGRMMDMLVLMRPEVTKNGDVKLIAENARIGDWSIPTKTLFTVLEGLPWPQWVQVRAQQHTIDVLITEKAQEGELQYRVREIDYEKARINLEVLIQQP